MRNGLKLRDDQEQAVAFMYERDRSLVLGSVGYGKTAPTLTAISEMLRDGICRRVLVIAPWRVCKDVWPQECEKWTPHLRLAAAIGTPDERRQAFDSDAQVVVTNFDNIQTLPDLSSFDAMVIDELTRLKNPGNPRSKKKTEQIKGKRFEALWRSAEHIKIRIGLTGSFTSNGLKDVFGQCRMVDPGILGVSKTVFLQKYFVLMNRDFGQWEPKVGSLQKVMAHIKPYTFVPDDKDYKDKLPPLHIVELRCDLADRKPYEQMKTKFKADFPDAQTIAANSGVVTNALKQMASGFAYRTVKRPDPDKPGKWIIERTSHWYDTSKFDLLDDLLEENQHANTIICYWYQEELAELRRRYPDAQTLDDPDAIARWNAGKIEKLLLHPRSASHGLNLQMGGNKIVFLSLPYYSQELFEQAYGRLHRTGQAHEVWCYVLLTNKTADELEWVSMQNKLAISEIATECLK